MFIQLGRVYLRDVVRIALVFLILIIAPFILESLQNQNITDIYGSRTPQVFGKNGVFGSFAKFTRKHLCRSLLLKK